MEKELVKLEDIKSEVQKIAEAISSVLNMDVIISDIKFQKIADTKRHFNLEVKEIKDTYVISKVIETGEVVIVKNKDDNLKCIECKERDECNLEAMICIPIKYKSSTLGAIGLIAISKEYRETLLENQQNLVEFLNRMAELIVSKVLERTATRSLELLTEQVISIINSVDEGIIALDEMGEIIHVNAVMEESISDIGDELYNKNICDVFPNTNLRKMIQKKLPFQDMEISFNGKGKEFNGLVSGKVVSIGEKSGGFILTFRKMADVYNVVNALSLNSLVTSFDDIIGESDAIELAKERSKKIANSDSTVLILGESGTGKELFARSIHYSSTRRDKPFIALNCAAIPESLLESELFGYEEGAFTGATKGGRIGKFQLAQGGTIFLDEIGDMPLHLQTKLLRVLQEKSFEKVGGNKSIVLDIRIIAATNKTLDIMVEDGGFREDLYYRLSVIPIVIPPLRDRKGDIEILLKFFLNGYNIKLKKNIKGFMPDAMTLLKENKWKGNVRELENVVEYGVNMENGDRISLSSLPQRIKDKVVKSFDDNGSFPTFESVERKLIEEALLRYGNTVRGKNLVSEILGISRATLYRKIKKYELE